MAWCLFSARPLSVQMLVYYQMNTVELISVTFEWNYNSIHTGKYIWKYCLQKGGYFVSALIFEKYNRTKNSTQQNCVDILWNIIFLTVNRSLDQNGVSENKQERRSSYNAANRHMLQVLTFQAVFNGLPNSLYKFPCCPNKITGGYWYSFCCRWFIMGPDQ